MRVVLLTLVTAATALAGPKIDFDARSFDFGSIPEGVRVTHTYVVRNTGDSDLIISAIRPSCGCTAAPIASKIIAPGQSTQLTVTFNSKRFSSGGVVKTVRVESNDPDVPNDKVTFTATVVPPSWPLAADPADVTFLGGAARAVTVSIRNNTKEAHAIMMIESPGAGVAVEVKSGRAPAGGEFVITFRLGADADPTKVATSATFEMDDQMRSRITIPITGAAPQPETDPDNPFLPH